MRFDDVALAVARLEEPAVERGISASCIAISRNRNASARCLWAWLVIEARRSPTTGIAVCSLNELATQARCTIGEARYLIRQLTWLGVLIAADGCRYTFPAVADPSGLRSLEKPAVASTAVH